MICLSTILDLSNLGYDWLVTIIRLMGLGAIMLMVLILDGNSETGAHEGASSFI